MLSPNKDQVLKVLECQNKGSELAGVVGSSRDGKEMGRRIMDFGGRQHGCS